MSAPRRAPARCCGDLRAVARGVIRDYPAEKADLEAALRINPNWLTPLDLLATLLASCSHADVRDGAKAMSLALRACELTEWKRATYLETVAAAYAELGRFDDAILMQQRAIQSAASQENQDNGAHSRLEAYRAGKPLRAE
jgi:tetratricopeptide (TPR) repeat protein